MLSWIRWWYWISVFAALLIVGGWMVSGGATETDERKLAPSPAGIEPLPVVDRGPLATASPTLLPVKAVQQAAVTSTFSLDPQAFVYVPWFGGNEPHEGEFAATEIGDVNGDHRDDLVVLARGVSTSSLSEILVYAQTSGHTLASPERYPIATDVPHATAMGDFNEDGRQDVLVTGYKDYTVLMSNLQGSFDVSTRPIFDPIEVGSDVPALTVQVDGDGHLDLVFFLARTHAGSSGFPTAETHSRLLILYGDGSGGFGRRYSFKTYGVDPYDVERPVSMASGDLNHDGRQDVAVRVAQFHYEQQTTRHLVRVYLNDGNKLVPGFDLNATMDVGGNYSAMDYIAVGDLNGDSRDDLAGSPGSMDLRLWVRYQTQTGGFDGVPAAYASEPIGTSLVVADLNKDGRRDLLIGHDAWDRATYHLQSNGELSPPFVRHFLTNEPPRISQTGVSVGDLDGDGCTDAAISLSYWGARLLRGSNCSLPPIAVCRTQVRVDAPSVGDAMSTTVPALVSPVNRPVPLLKGPQPALVRRQYLPEQGRPLRRGHPDRADP